MAVYVDQPIFPFGRMMMCHLWADTVEELHAMAARLGLKRAWFQCPPKASWEHYDVSKGVRALALKLGAIETDRYGAAYFTAKRDGRADMVERIERIRARRKAAEEDKAEPSLILVPATTRPGTGAIRRTFIDESGPYPTTGEAFDFAEIDHRLRALRIARATPAHTTPNVEPAE